MARLWRRRLSAPAPAKYSAKQQNTNFAYGANISHYCYLRYQARELHKKNRSAVCWCCRHCFWSAQLYLDRSTSASRLRPPFKLKLCHNAPLPTPLSSPAKKATQMGLEPTTFRLEVERAVHCATRSHTQHKKHPRLPGVRGKAFSPKGV